MEVKTEVATKEIKKQLQLGIEKARCLSHGLNPVSLEKKSFQECLIERGFLDIVETGA